MEAKEINKKLKKIRGLKDGWNGVGSHEINKYVINELEYILKFTRGFNFYPIGSGHIGIEIMGPEDKTGIEIELACDGVYYDLIDDYQYVVEDMPITVEDAIALLIHYKYLI